MKKFMYLLLSMIVVFGLAACGDSDEEEKEVSSVETSGQTETEGTEDNDAESDEDVAEDEVEETTDYEEVLLDSDSAKVVLESISKVEDKDWDEEYHSIKLSIENKTDKTIVIQSEEVSADGLMVTDDVFFSEEVAGGKKANGELRIETFDEDLPPLDEELEFILLVLDDETYEEIESQQVNIEIK